MSSPAFLLERVAQALLSDLATPSREVDLARLAREVWAGWARERDDPGRQAEVQALVGVAPEQLSGLIDDIARRLLSGRAGPEFSALSRYLAVLPPLLRRLDGLVFAHADDLRRWLPSGIPHFRAGDHPPGVGDQELVVPIRVEPPLECWLARNPCLPRRPEVLLAFFPGGPALAEPTLAWHRELDGTPGIVSLEHTYLSAEVPCLQFPFGAATGLLTASPRQRPSIFRQLVEIVGTLRRRTVPHSAGALVLGDVVLTPGKEPRPALLGLDPPEGQTDQEMARLAHLGRLLFPEAEGPLAEILASCTPSDPLHGPPDIGILLSRLEALTGKEDEPGTAGSVPSPSPSVRRRGTTGLSASVWNVLGELQKAAPERPKLVVNSPGMRFQLIPAGKYHMGAPPNEPGRRDNEGPVHEVVLTRAVYFGICPVTQEQYQRVMGQNPSRFQGAAGGGPDFPVENVSWDDAVAFCARLGELSTEKHEGRVYRLPTEAEWEYACRAGTATPFHLGASLCSGQANFDGNHPYGGAARGPAVPRTTRVGSFEANYFGLFDMHGNVWEWCADWYDAGYYQRSSRQDPAGPPEGLYRVLRGGSWRNQATTCRSAYRNALAPNQRQPFIGFRVVLETVGQGM